MPLKGRLSPSVSLPFLFFPLICFPSSELYGVESFGPWKAGGASKTQRRQAQDIPLST